MGRTRARPADSSQIPDWHTILLPRGRNCAAEFNGCYFVVWAEPPPARRGRLPVSLGRSNIEAEPLPSDRAHRGQSLLLVFAVYNCRSTLPPGLPQGHPPGLPSGLPLALPPGLPPADRFPPRPLGIPLHDTTALRDFSHSLYRALLRAAPCSAPGSSPSKVSRPTPMTYEHMGPGGRS